MARWRADAFTHKGAIVNVQAVSATDFAECISALRTVFCRAALPKDFQSTGLGLAAWTLEDLFKACSSVGWAAGQRPCLLRQLCWLFVFMRP